jgi:hypothetical protein
MEKLLDKLMSCPEHGNCNFYKLFSFSRCNLVKTCISILSKTIQKRKQRIFENDKLKIVELVVE